MNTTKSIGNIVALKIPHFKFDVACATNPTIPGPDAQPISPPKARIANIAVPPCGYNPEERLNTPGHIMPTENPQIPQAISEITGIGEKTTTK